MQTQLVCPHCGSTLTFGAEIKAGAPVTCLICSQSFAAANPKPVSPVAAKPAPSTGTTVAQVKSPPKTPTTAKPSVATAAPSTRVRKPVEEPGNNVAMLAFTVVLLVLLTAGIGYGVWRITNHAKNDTGDNGDKQLVDNTKPANKDGDKSPGAGDKDKKADAKEKDTKPEVKDPQPDPNKDKTPEATDKKDQGKDEVKPPPPLTKQEEEAIRKKNQDEIKKVLQRKNPPKVGTPEPDPEPEKPPVVVKKGPVEQQQINDAIEKGIAYLKKTQKGNGTWGETFEIGHAALAGLTLLECKVDAKEKVIQDAARCVRERVQKCTFNYELSLAILFLDRLGDPNDKVLIQEAALRLIAGQKDHGGWFYTCPDLSGPEIRNLWAFLQSHRPPAKGVKGPTPMRLDQVAVSLRTLPIVKYQGFKKDQLPKPTFGDPKNPIGQVGMMPVDNSNTQFAILALWAARRHDVNADQALIVAWKYFMTTQNEDGGWGYMPGHNTKDTMVNVGLLGLALGHGASPDFEPANPKAFRPALKDENIQRGLQMLARYIGEPVREADKATLKMENLYLLWCIERVAMLYDLPTIGGKDWYGWGAQILVKHQMADGAWGQSEYTGASAPLNTCFALLFLRRSNLVQDLTHTFRFHSGIRDEK